MSHVRKVKEEKNTTRGGEEIKFLKLKGSKTDIFV